MDPFSKYMLDQERNKKVQFNFIKKNIAESPSFFKNLDLQARATFHSDKMISAKE